MNEAKKQILQVAFKLFLKKGYKEVTMTDILSASGLSRGTFYYYFKSKEQLFAEVIDLFFITIPSAVKRPIGDESLNAFYHDYLVNASLTYASLGETIKDAGVDVFNAFKLTLDAMKRLPEYREKTRAVKAGIAQVWIRIIQAARARGEIASVMTDEQIAWFFLFTMDGMGIRSEMEGRPQADNDRELLALWDAFYAQIKG